MDYLNCCKVCKNVEKTTSKGYAVCPQKRKVKYKEDCIACSEFVQNPKLHTLGGTPYGA